MDPNQNQNTPPPNQQPMPGFGPYSRLLRDGIMSPTIPNQPQFSPTQSPPIHFNQIQQNFNPHSPFFNQNFNDPRTFLQPQFEQPNFYGGGGSQQQTPDVVEETQADPEPTKKKKGSRRRANAERQEEKITSNDEELVALADAWCTTSMDEIRGTDQKADGYWSTIRCKLAATLGKPENYRSVDSITSKWTKMKGHLTKFNGIYMRLSRNKPSGWNELKLLDEAHKVYKAENRNNAFTLKNVWDRIRFEPKWMSLANSSTLSSGSKRARADLESSMGSDAHVNVDLNVDSDAIPIDDEVDPLHTRPPLGRDKAKRIQKFGDNIEARAKHREKIEKSMEAHLAAMEKKKEARERFEAEHAELIEQQKLINHLTIMEKGGLDDEDVEIVHEAKKESRSWLKKFLKK